MASPAHQQYLAIKNRYPDALLLFRMGDFYEMFGEDAKVGAQALQIALTSREFAKGDRVPMAGIPHHALQGYLKRFLEQGLKVAICEQLTEPGKGLVDRDVVRVVTPGTLVEPELLSESRNNYLCAINPGRAGYGLAYVDVTTGEFAVAEFDGADAVERLEAELLRLNPAECLVPSAETDVAVPGSVTVHDDYRFDPQTARDLLCRLLEVQSLEGFGCAQMPLAIGAAGAIVSYLEHTDPGQLKLLTRLHTYATTDFMTLDRYTRRNLELTESARLGGVRGSLLWVLDHTETAMGARLMRRLVGQPLLDPEALDRRLDAVAELEALPVLRAQLKTFLGGIVDIQRIAGRISQGIAISRDLLGLNHSLQSLVQAESLLGNAESDELRLLRSQIDACPDIAALIARAVADPASGRVIRPGFSSELDELVESVSGSRDWIARLEAVERDRTGIKSLKVGYNKVFGYYIEVSNSNLASVPPDYVRKQTLVNAERFITPELKEREARVLQAEERIGAMERRIFNDLLETLTVQSDRLQATAGALAYLDVYRSLADVAATNRYARPQLDRGDVLEIKGGRHPVVELSQEEGFIANDCLLDAQDRQILVTTGPNMGGKSTYLRQVALIVLMAQIGSFVPAESARIGLVDRIFTRVGAQDDIAAGQSTFMVEMVETANILNHATARSLLVLDEIGRGTSTYDGLAIARSVLEFIHDRLGARTLFATHYQELTSLADVYQRIHNANVAVLEEDGRVVFQHRVVPGGADRSYGIHVGTLAGLPKEVTKRAEETLHELEAQSEQNGRSSRRSKDAQLALFGQQSNGAVSRLLDELIALDIPSLTPLEAINRLHELQQKAGRGEE